MLIQIFIGCVFFMMQLSLSKENKCELDTITSYYDWFLWTCEQRFLCTMDADVDLQYNVIKSYARKNLSYHLRCQLSV